MSIPTFYMCRAITDEGANRVRQQCHAMTKVHRFDGLADTIRTGTVMVAYAILTWKACMRSVAIVHIQREKETHRLRHKPLCKPFNACFTPSPLAYGAWRRCFPTSPGQYHRAPTASWLGRHGLRCRGRHWNRSIRYRRTAQTNHWAK